MQALIKHRRSIVASLRLLSLATMLLMAFGARAVFAQEDDSQDMPPPRIGMVSGSASFWRPGAENWTAAQVNTPLAEGDALYTGAGATLEVQIGTRAYARLAQGAMLTLLDNQPKLQQFKVSSGIVAFDLRSLSTGRNIELDTPSGAFYINSAGYYRMEVSDNATHFIVRRGGDATVTLADGSSRLIAPSQEAVIETGDRQGDVETYVAPEADAWDTWNTSRTDDLIDAISNRYVSPDVYGTDDLDHYGAWRTTPEYGPVWVPSGMAPDWAPYSTGSWVWDPVYAWTWVDSAPWGWAPYHYGRWVNTGGFWAWCPGPRLRRPAYAPALVAFFHTGGGTVQASFGGPGVSWVALGWGEPVLPWWGASRRNFTGRPWWGGWAGPRVVNNVVVQNNIVINNVNNIHYRNFDQRNAVIAVRESSFGRGPVAGAVRVEPTQAKDFKPIVGQHLSRPAAASFSPVETRVGMPAQTIVNRSAVVLHDAPRRGGRWNSAEPPSSGAAAVPQNRVVTVRPQNGQTTPWAAFGKAAGPERGEPRHPPEPPRSEEWPARVVPQAQLPEQHQPAKPITQEPLRPYQPQQLPERIVVTPPAVPAQTQEQRQLPNTPNAPKAEQQIRVVPPQRQEPANIVMPPQHREAAPEAPPSVPREIRQQARPEQQREQTHNEIRAETPRPLPGQPANQLYQRREEHNEAPRQAPHEAPRRAEQLKKDANH